VPVNLNDRSYGSREDPFEEESRSAAINLSSIYIFLPHLEKASSFFSCIHARRKVVGFVSKESYLWKAIFHLGMDSKMKYCGCAGTSNNKISAPPMARVETGLTTTNENNIFYLRVIPRTTFFADCAQLWYESASTLHRPASFRSGLQTLDRWKNCLTFLNRVLV